MNAWGVVMICLLAMDVGINTANRTAPGLCSRWPT